MLPKHYNFTDIQQKFIEAWEQDNCFDPDMQASEVMSIMMPPPNVTGTLHLGHALDNTLPDVLMRRARMQGKAALYQPGTDHASIAVHVVLERELNKEGKTRFDLGREAFLERAMAWKDQSHGTITSQLRQLGISCDWNNERFTLDEHYYAAVKKVFIELYERNLIYRGQRLVNWDPNMQTAVSDLEVKHKEIEGHLWHFMYPFADGGSYNGEKGIHIATTRPETILADGAIAINPQDERAADLVGRMVTVPIVNREIPIIADDYVDLSFGSGMVKITAAHDFNDFEAYKRHQDSANIPLINLMTPDAHMNENCPADYQGLDRFTARQKIIDDFKSLGLFVKEVPHTHQVPIAERDDTILEPYLTQQWYVKGQPLAEKILQAMDAGEFDFVHDRDRRVLRNWLENIEDWCISRQLWWGHRIPAWFKGDDIYVGHTPPTEPGWTQDEDILDTWFSSALWPFVTQGWPTETDRLQKFFPGHAIMNGWDILPFWDMRMLMMSLEFCDTVPFQKIYTHGMILDEHGQKMSKSKGNVVDPTDMMNQYGTDALRMTMASIASPLNMRFSEQKVEQHRNFCTKLWNAARYMEMNGVQLNDAQMPEPHLDINKWLVSELKSLFNKVDEALDKYEFHQATYDLYHFTWGTWCDWYLELTKPHLQADDAAETKQVMGWAFAQLLKGLHPVVPFVTEELWSQLNGSGYLMQANWPKYAEWPIHEEAQTGINWLIDIISSVRQLRAEVNVPHKAAVELQIVDATAADWSAFQQYETYLATLAKVEKVTKASRPASVTDAVNVIHGIKIQVPLENVVDFAAEKARIEKEIDKYKTEQEKIAALLDNQDFVDRAPPEVITRNEKKLSEINDNLSKLNQVYQQVSQGQGA